MQYVGATDDKDIHSDVVGHLIHLDDTHVVTHDAQVTIVVEAKSAARWLMFAVGETLTAKADEEIARLRELLKGHS